MTKIDPQPGIMEISPYVGGKSSIEGMSNIVKLSSNENPFGPADSVKEAIARAAHDVHRYPSVDHAELRAAIAEIHGVQADRIICGVGSDEVLHMLAQAYAGPGEEIIYTEHGFSMYKIIAHAVGATPVVAPEQERVVDVDAVLEACTDRTRVVFLTNPGNPTSTMIGLSEVERLAEGIPEQAILVLDGAYAEYVEGYDGGAKLVEMRENVVMTRTFSKLYGLGGMRVGWGYGPHEIIDVLNRIRQPFNLSTVALAAAETAVRDTAYTEYCRSENARLRVWLAEALGEHGVPCDTSMANFVLARFSCQDEAEACDTYLQKQGIIVRRVAGYGLPNALRITVGDESSCRRVAHSIGLFKAGER
ncbi:histidinol-phosphate transaminase [Pacificoceanicola onchidii]|uniref:histidinol-phosphate transaminase n=1 Tax=Pacificoceanicola onchidii TaxID=2562685 RepID=UPI0010A5CBF4|nr:histidinol-phosphate transaminase [Pacificoceanicola onchidii]